MKANDGSHSEGDGDKEMMSKRDTVGHGSSGPQTTGGFEKAGKAWVHAVQVSRRVNAYGMQKDTHTHTHTHTHTPFLSFSLTHSLTHT